MTSCIKCGRSLLLVCSKCKEIPDFCKCEKDVENRAKDEKEGPIHNKEHFHPEFPYTR
jgi:hypothetical protein